MSQPNPQAIPDGDGVVSRAQVAEFFGITVKSIDRMVALGKLRKIKIGGCTRFSTTEVRSMIH
jgi:predicted DNA-binding transcriptional regulator AlpA